MHSDERDICIYLKSWRGQMVSGIDISKKAGGKGRFRKDPQWAVEPLTRLVARGVVERDSNNHYRLKPIQKKNSKTKRWVAPHIQKMLDQSGKKFEFIREHEDDFLGS